MFVNYLSVSVIVLGLYHDLFIKIVCENCILSYVFISLRDIVCHACLICVK